MTMLDHLDVSLTSETARAVNMLGYSGKDLVTGMQGIVTSVAFDLYGCIQVCINPGLDKDGKHRESSWYDSTRIEIDTAAERVLPLPLHCAEIIAAAQLTGEEPASSPKGPAEKPVGKI